MKDFLALLVSAVLIMGAHSILNPDLYKGEGSGLSLGFGMSSAHWKKPHNGGHREGKVFGMNYSVRSKITGDHATKGRKLEIDHGKLMDFFHKVAKHHAGVDLNEIASGNHIQIGSGEGRGLASGKEIIFGEGRAISRGDAGGLGIGHGRGLFVKEGGIRGHGKGIGIGFSLGNGEGHGQSPDIIKLLRQFGHKKK